MIISKHLIIQRKICALLTRSSIYSNGVTPYYDLVITDHHMPSSGTEQVESLGRKKTRVIIVQIGRTRLHAGTESRRRSIAQTFLASPTLIKTAKNPVFEAIVLRFLTCPL